MHVILYEPEIPPNTGNIIRLCANTGMGLHLIQPLGFSLDDKQMRRAGLDYLAKTCLQVHQNLDSFLAEKICTRIFAISTHGKQGYSQVSFEDGDGLLFGPETRGLPSDILSQYNSLRIPMREGNRSINLSNAVSIVAYEAWRQLDFVGGA